MKICFNLVYSVKGGSTVYRADFVVFFCLFFNRTVWLTSSLIKSYPNPAGRKKLYKVAVGQLSQHGEMLFGLEKNK